MFTYKLRLTKNFKVCPEYQGRVEGPGYCKLMGTLCWVDSYDGECTYLDEFEVGLIEDLDDK